MFLFREYQFKFKFGWPSELRLILNYRLRAVSHIHKFIFSLFLHDERGILVVKNSNEVSPYPQNAFSTPPILGGIPQRSVSSLKPKYRKGHLSLLRIFQCGKNITMFLSQASTWLELGSLANFGGPNFWNSFRATSSAIWLLFYWLFNGGYTGSCIFRISFHLKYCVIWSNVAATWVSYVWPKPKQLVSVGVGGFM